jgi:hypothetical protein
MEKFGNGVRKSAVWKKPAHAGTESPTPVKLGSITDAKRFGRAF